MRVTHKLKIFAKPKSMFNIVKKPDSLLDWLEKKIWLKISFFFAFWISIHELSNRVERSSSFFWNRFW